MKGRHKPCKGEIVGCEESKAAMERHPEEADAYVSGRNWVGLPWQPGLFPSFPIRMEGIMVLALTETVGDLALSISFFRMKATRP